MILIKEIDKKDFELCFELDSKTITMWSKKQWEKEIQKDDTKVFGLLLTDLIIGICAFQIVLDEAQINFFSVNLKYQRKGFGTYLMNYLIKECENFKIKRLLLEVSASNLVAIKFYNNFDFHTVGRRKNYYQDGCDALLKEKKIIKK
tara:strand:- start:147 stop:587 length:441 start_codon:yes stop_codon:yes gene_type:complete